MHSNSDMRPNTPMQGRAVPERTGGPACVWQFVIAALSWLGIASGAPLDAQAGAAGGAVVGGSQPANPGTAATDAIRALLAKLDDCFNRRDLAGYLGLFEPDHAGVHAMMQRRLERLFTTQQPLHRTSTLATEPRRVGPRTLVRVRHELQAQTGPVSPTDPVPSAGPANHSMIEDTMLALRAGEAEFVPTFAIEMPAQTKCVVGDLFRCPACNYEIGAVPGWLCVPLRSDRAQAIDAASFYLLGTDLACDVSVQVDAAAPDALSVARQLGETLHELDPTARPGLVTPWLPPAHRESPPKGLAGARLEIDLPADAAETGGSRAVFHVIAFGGLQHLLLARGSRRAWQQHADSVEALLQSYHLIESNCERALAEARPMLQHTGGSLRGTLYHNTIFGLELQGPEGWSPELRAGGAAFCVRWSSPSGSRLWMHGYAVPAGMNRWCRETADRWVNELCDRAGLDLRPETHVPGPTVDVSQWTEQAGCGGHTRFVVGTPREPVRPDAPRQRLMRLLVNDDLMVVVDGHATTSDDLHALRRALESLRRP
ncbi:MAG: hypothetical protein ABIP94_13580 [Planctomycetota bacterium]